MESDKDVWTLQANIYTGHRKSDIELKCSNSQKHILVREIWSNIFAETNGIVENTL